MRYLESEGLSLLDYIGKMLVLGLLFALVGPLLEKMLSLKISVVEIVH